jgi:hypothetical protein
MNMHMLVRTSWSSSMTWRSSRWILSWTLILISSFHCMCVCLCVCAWVYVCNMIILVHWKECVLVCELNLPFRYINIFTCRLPFSLGNRVHVCRATDMQFKTNLRVQTFIYSLAASCCATECEYHIGIRRLSEACFCHVFVCVWVCTCMCMHVCMYVYMFSWMCEYGICIWRSSEPYLCHVLICVCTCMCICMCIQTWSLRRVSAMCVSDVCLSRIYVMCVYAYADVCVCMCICMCAFIGLKSEACFCHVYMEWVCICVHACMYAYVYVYMYMYMHVYMHMSCVWQ